jgi:transcription termination/antitermination protein NusG
VAKAWYVARVQTGKEEKIKDTLEKHIKSLGLESLITRVIVPQEKIAEIKGGKKKVSSKKLYPSYLMIEMELTDDTWLAIKEVPGIGDFVGGRTKPAPLEQHEVDKMLILESDIASDKAPDLKIKFKKGDNVRIKEGPFENFDGNVEEINPTKGNVKVIINIFGRATPVELEYWQLEPV